jgi:hypothetical protein
MCLHKILGIYISAFLLHGESVQLVNNVFKFEESAISSNWPTVAVSSPSAPRFPRSSHDQDFYGLDMLRKDIFALRRDVANWS